MILKMLSPYRKLFNATLTAGLRNLSRTATLKKSHYEVLELNRDATQAEIKNAYFRLTKMYHPDKIAATDENLKKFREISEAYEVLGNDHSRKLYDKGLLGDIKRVGMEEADQTDPIIAFYKQRQDMAKILGVKPDGIGVWTQSNFAEAKEKKQHDLFSMKTTGGLKFDPIPEQFFLIGYFAFIAFLLLLNFDNTPPANFYKTVRKYLDF